ncbi:hypothetical protein AGMMS49545_16260 [Betaproteobacteria bacterium]|nr:hypothetical protein AGMMS49545_16260 [Betaproteobacteria bacterium]GHU42054.1 hypothetical protein AGMMS50289_06140 [Betaproteobacteria bacterium]
MVLRLKRPSLIAVAGTFWGDAAKLTAASHQQQAITQLGNLYITLFGDAGA